MKHTIKIRRRSKLDTLKYMVAIWDHNRSITDAWAICEFLKDNLHIDEDELMGVKK